MDLQMPSLRALFSQAGTFLTKCGLDWVGKSDFWSWLKVYVNLDQGNFLMVPLMVSHEQLAAPEGKKCRTGKDLKDKDKSTY